MQDILINWAPQETRVAIVEAGAVQELHIERTLERGLVGNIYAGRVARVLPGMQSAFVDIGLERAAFLHVADVHVSGQGGAGQRGGDGANGGAPAAPIERLVFEGQTLTVQVIKDPIGTKGARLSSQISIAGRLLVFLPQDDHIGVSQKIGSHELREQLRTRMQALVQLPDGTTPNGGFILRTNAEDASDAELLEDIGYLRKAWAAVRERAFKSPPGTLLHQDLSLVQRVLRDLTDEATQSIRIDSALQFETLRQFGRAFTPTSVGKLEHYKGERPIFDLFNIDEEIARALQRRVDLKSGGYLIVDQTEALTTVDVNTGGFVGARNFDDTVFKTNLEAAHAIARQLRLRNLGGIIIIDFIDMAREEHQATVLAELRKQLARDRTKITVSGFTQLGLVEMTR
jgi:ribonuclease G